MLVYDYVSRLDTSTRVSVQVSTRYLVVRNCEIDKKMKTKKIDIKSLQ